MPEIELAAHPLGLTWVVEDRSWRACHALAHDGRVWIVDPLDEGDAIERATALGDPVAVLQLFMVHNRDCEAVAKRLGVPLVKLPDALPDSPFSVLNLDQLGWKERALWWPEPRGLIVAESIGTTPYMALGPGPAGMHPFRRPVPPTQLRTFMPEHLLVGHGSPVHGGEAAAALLDALHRSRRDIPKFALKLPGLIRRMWGRS